MIVTEARFAANRRNAQSSTGPRTRKSKERCRANALMHEVCTAFIVPEDFEFVRRRSNDLFNALKPQCEWHSELVGQVAILSIRAVTCDNIGNTCSLN